MPHNGVLSQFAHALLDRNDPPPSLRLAGDPDALQLRFGVYRNNVFSSLVSVLSARYPAVKVLLGEEFFRAMAAAFIRAHPPESPVMLEYGAKFPDFAAAFGAAVDYPYIAGVAQLEWAAHEATHAADASATDISALHTIDPARFGDAVLRLHPAVRLVSSPYPVHSIWRASLDPSSEPEAELSGAEHVLVTRPDFELAIQVVPRGAFAFLSALLDGAALGIAAEAGFAEDAGFDLAQTLALAFASGAVEHVHVP
jgi:hypothetical protein